MAGFCSGQKEKIFNFCIPTKGGIPARGVIARAIIIGELCGK